MLIKIRKTILMFLLGGCLLLSACGQQDAAEPSSAEPSAVEPPASPAPQGPEAFLNPDGTINQEKWNQYMGIEVPEQEPVEEVPENVLLLGALNDDYEMIHRLIASFNQAQSDYKVEVRKYGSRDDMFLDLVRGQGCDLLFLKPLYLKTLAGKGGLEDLTPYLDKSGKVDREDLFDAVLEAGTADGKLAGLMSGFSVEAILVEKGYTEDGGWTIEEYLALMDKYPEVPLSGTVDPNLIIVWLTQELSALPESFVNWEERTCDFENEAFIQTIEMLKSYVERCRKPGSDRSMSTADRLYQRVVQTMIVEIDYDLNFSSYTDISDAFLESYELAGFPNQEGEVRYPMPQLYTGQGLYCMNAASAKKDAAWLFLEYMLTEYQEQRAQSTWTEGFPVRRSLVERLLQEEVEAEVTEKNLTTNFYTREMRPKRGGFTEEDRERVLYILDHATPPTILQAGGTFREILVEELQAFLAGDKTAAETAQLIQRRVSLYLSE